MLNLILRFYLFIIKLNLFCFDFSFMNYFILFFQRNFCYIAFYNNKYTNYIKYLKTQICVLK